MMFYLRITCDGAAFGEANDLSERATEVSCILEGLAKAVQKDPPRNAWTLRDTNGNKVGSAEFKE